MSKKDKKIEQCLIDYAESVKPDDSILEPAIFALRAQNANRGYIPIPARTKKTRVWAFAAIAAAVIVFLSFVISQSGLFDSGTPSDPTIPAQYKLSDFNYESAPFSQILQSETVLTLDLGADNVYTNARVYTAKTGGEPAVISVYYKTVGTDGLDEIVVIADLKNGLQDYQSFQNFTVAAIGGTAVYLRQEQENGEYYTDAYFAYDGVGYYVRIMSPASDAGHRYILQLLQ